MAHNSREVRLSWFLRSPTPIMERLSWALSLGRGQTGVAMEVIGFFPRLVPAWGKMA